MRKQTLLFILAAFLLLNGCKGESGQSTQLTAVLKGVNLVDGKEISSQDFEGDVLLVNFWATWCPPCKEEIPDFIQLYKQYKDKGVSIVGISTDQSSEEVKAFITEQQMNYPVIMVTQEILESYEKAINRPIRSIPTTLVVSPKGEIKNTFVGFQSKEVFEAEILKGLEEKQPQTTPSTAG